MEKIAIVLAGGLGKRMNSHLPKPAIKIGEKSMLQLVLDKLYQLGLTKIYVVYGKKGDLLKGSVVEDERIVWVEQEPQLGTGHAVQVAVRSVEEKRGDVIVCNGDAPFVRRSTMERLIGGNSLLVCRVNDASGYGRILEEEGEFVGIVEEKDASEEQRKIRKINGGVYGFDLEMLKENVGKLDNNNAQKEYYLTDLMGIMVRNGERVRLEEIEDDGEIYNVNDRQQLEYAQTIAKNYLEDF